MPMFDRACPNCHRQMLDQLEPSDAPVVRCPVCNVPTERVWVQKASAIIGDEIDVTIRNGLCHADGTPRRFRSRAELKAAEKQAGMVNYVVHQPGRGSDKSKHTSRWV